jgi:hypothetical protein
VLLRYPDGRFRPLKQPQKKRAPPLKLTTVDDRSRKIVVTMPTVPILFSQPVPKGFDDFSSLGGLGDIQLPMLVSAPSGNRAFGAGATWSLPTATRGEFGRDQ